MSLKQAATNSLLMFVAATCVVLIVKAVAPTPSTLGSGVGGAATQVRGTDVASSSTLADGVHVYYLHGNFRCTTCRTIEEYAEDAVRSGFGDQLLHGEVHWHVVNYDETENRQFALDYEVAAPTVVLARFAGGRRVAWENLPEVWSFVGNKRLFLTYVQGSLREFLGGDAPAAPSAEESPASVMWNVPSSFQTTEK